MQHLGWRVFTCDVCGTQFRYERVAWATPEGTWPPVIHGDIHDPDTDAAQRQHATTHGGFLDKQLAYTGPTTYTTTKEPPCHP